MDEQHLSDNGRGTEPSGLPFRLRVVNRRESEERDTDFTVFVEADGPRLLHTARRLTRERTVVVPRYQLDLQEAAIAAELSIAVGTVKSNLSRAPAKLRNHPGFDTPDHPPGEATP
jgi:DNA-binding NarL/FixJ family response regulator